MVPTASSPGFELPEHLVDEGGDGQRHAVLPARLQRYPEVFVVELDLATRLEIVAEQFVPLYLHGPVRRQAPG